jgi:hypothetical protein
MSKPNLLKKIDDLEGINSYTNKASYDSFGNISKVETFSGTELIERATFTYLSNHIDIESITEVTKDKTVIKSFNYIDGEIESINKSVLNVGL